MRRVSLQASATLYPRAERAAPNARGQDTSSVPLGPSAGHTPRGRLHPRSAGAWAALAAVTIGGLLGPVAAVLIGLAPAGAPPSELLLDRIEVVAPSPGPVERALTQRLSAFSKTTGSVDLRALLRTVVGSREPSDEVSATFVAQEGYIRSSNAPVHIAAGTELTVSVTGDSIYLGAEPAITWHESGSLLPGLQVHWIMYDFATGQVRASATSVGPSEFYSTQVARRIQPLVAQLLPKDVRTPGYQPGRDPELEVHLGRIIDNAARLSTRAGLTDRSKLSEPSVRVAHTIAKSITLPIPGSPYKAWLESGSTLALTGESTGAAGHPLLRELKLSSSKPVLVGGGDKPPKIGVAQLSSLSLLPGAKMEAEATVTLETAATGLGLLFAIPAALSGQHVDLSPPPSRTPAPIARRLADARPQVLSTLHAFGREVPGAEEFFQLAPAAKP